jgi:5-methylcytosine-specific restriction protein A
MSGLKRKACARPGCPTVHTNPGSYCDEHKPKILDDRPSSAARGYGSRWRTESAAYLVMHPWCQCQDCRSSRRPLRAEVVDHIKPHRGDESLFWDRNNWQALNKRCHDRKTARHDGGFGV